MTGESSPTAIDKAFLLLRAMAEHEETMFGISQLARLTGLPKSTAFRLITSLERNGAVAREGHHYRFVSLHQDALRLPDTPQVRRIQTTMTPLLSALFEQTRQTVQLATLHEDAVLFLNKLHGVLRTDSPSRIGGRAPAYCTSVGKAMLAFDMDATERVIARGLERWTPNTILEPSTLTAQLSKVRRTRIGLDDEEYVPNVVSVAAPVLAPDGAVIASLCITWPRSEGFHPRYRHLVLDAANRAAQRYASHKD